MDDFEVVLTLYIGPVKEPTGRHSATARFEPAFAVGPALSYSECDPGSAAFRTVLPASSQAQVLSSFGIELDATRTIIENQIGRGEEVIQGEIDYVPRVRKVLSLALDEAERQGSGYVRTEHILLGIVRDGGGVAANILDHFGVLGKVRQDTFALLGK